MSEQKCSALLLALAVAGLCARAQTTTLVVNPYNPPGTGGYNYAAGDNPNSGSLEITASFSAANHFTITVNPLIRPVLSSITISTRRIILTINGTQGPDYTLLTSTNLIPWQTLFTTNAPVPPLILTDTNFGRAALFYRVQCGP